MKIIGKVWEQRSSGAFLPEGEIAPCDPFLVSRVDAIEVDGARHTPDPWKLDARLPAGVVLPNGCDRFMDAQQYLLPMDVGDHAVEIG